MASQRGRWEAEKIFSREKVGFSNPRRCFYNPDFFELEKSRKIVGLLCKVESAYHYNNTSLNIWRMDFISKKMCPISRDV